MTDGSAFLIPIALVLLLRGYRETMRPREAWSKGMDWKPPPEILRPERARVKLPQSLTETAGSGAEG